MSVFGHGASDVGLGILMDVSAGLSYCPVIVEVAGKGGVRMGVLWHWSPDVRLRILSNCSIELSNSPVVVEVAGEC